MPWNPSDGGKNGHINNQLDARYKSESIRLLVPALVDPDPTNRGFVGTPTVQRNICDVLIRVIVGSCFFS
ncbi:hypothetical protein N7509_005216 [Penicillium cosmopolitanum]|uniref:Uncharacterized protein n=1 Tax=Penicillium cosmopolitanum TaxID=1131564 RepID=A0A9W9W1S4_9EURO|nr:uncharacterized protein N7509_005216 [Penicillium cosmopolitanum]KAJ5397103.1 hypothetical protein N7509_005216 [Penicillium cosmopolitanum]